MISHFGDGDTGATSIRFTHLNGHPNMRPLAQSIKAHLYPWSNMSMSTKDRHDFLQPVAVSMYHKYRTNCYRNYLSKWLSAVVRFTLGVAEELNFLHAQLLQGNPSSDHLGQYDYPQSSRSWYNHCNSPMVYSLWFSCRERWCLRHWLADISTR